MGAAALQLLGHVDIVFQGVLIPVGVQNIAGIADGGLADLALVAHLVHGDLHAGNPVQGVEYTEHVHAGARGLLNELPDHVVRIVGVAHGVGAPQQHLQQ